MRRLYADLNDLSPDGSLWLTCAGSVASIKALDPALAEGEEVVLTDGELWAVGRVVRRADGAWEVRAGWRLKPGEPGRAGSDDGDLRVRAGVHDKKGDLQ